jgi:hypothetical protein
MAERGILEEILICHGLKKLSLIIEMLMAFDSISDRKGRDGSHGKYFVHPFSILQSWSFFVMGQGQRQYILSVLDEFRDPQISI